jgi:uncharacterized protein
MHSNGEIIKQAYDAFGRGDMSTVFGILDKGIKWHVPGQSPLSGDYRGHDEVMGFFKKCMDLSQGTLRIDLRDIAATESSIFVLLARLSSEYGRKAERPRGLEIND